MHPLNTAELQIIVLAAGARSAPSDGAALQQMLSRATAVSGHAVTAVLGDKAAEVAPALGRLPVSLVVNRDWNEGIAGYIRAGLHSLPGSCAAAMVLLGHQLAVTSADLQRLCDLWRRSPRAIVAAQYGGGYGTPAIFPRAEFPSLLRLRGDQGAEALLRGPMAEVIGVPMPGAMPDAPSSAGSSPPIES